jgi:hypothetical protein
MNRAFDFCTLAYLLQVSLNSFRVCTPVVFSLALYSSSTPLVGFTHIFYSHRIHNLGRYAYDVRAAIQSHSARAAAAGIASNGIVSSGDGAGEGNSNSCNSTTGSDGGGGDGEEGFAGFFEKPMVSA